jgi:3-deoxy-D-manno-octulosonic-acid transferase
MAPSASFPRSLLLGLSWRFYDALLSAVVWAALVPLTALRILAGRSSRDELRQRLGRPRVAAARSTRILVHAVSAGEAAGAGAFVRALAQARPDWSVIMSYGNSDARTVAAALRRRMPCIDAVIALPWDRRAPLRRWLATLDVSAVVVVEPEIWPNLYRACRTQRIPLFLANGRVYQQDVWRYRAARWFFRDVLRVPAWIGVQTTSERDRFVAIGAPATRIEVAGSFKFDTLKPPGDSPLRQRVFSARRSGPVIVAGSTHAGEELLLVEAFERLRAAHPQLRLVVAPRHVTRAQDIVACLRARGHDAILASTPDGSTWTILVVDLLGELAGLYRAADVAFVGGSLTNHGGHNVLEPARAGRATVVGPSVHNVQHLVAGLASVNGIEQLQDVSVDSLHSAFDRLLTDSVGRHTVGARARLYCMRHRGAARRSVEAVVSRVCARATTTSEAKPQTLKHVSEPRLARLYVV